MVTDSSSRTPSSLETKRPTLLIVDDEEGPRQSLRIVFKQEYEVHVACSGQEALAIAREHSIDVAILDILMSGMSGVDLLRELKQLDPTIQIVMLTAYETLETARQALRYGASDYLNKPFDIRTIRSAVARAVDKHRAASEFQRGNEQLARLQSEIDRQRLSEEMERTKGEIYASVLHDINSPLTVISGFIDLINRSMQNAAKVEGEQLELIKDDLRQLTGEVGRCFEISRRYLRFLNRDAPENMSSGVQQILRDLKELLSRHPAAHGHHLSVNVPEMEVRAKINGTDLLQILLNLTINALQATERPHRVDVRCFRLDHALDVSKLVDSGSERFINRSRFENRAPLVGITVDDTGPGIAPHLVPRMFEEQFSTKSADRGTGLGLSIVKRLVNAVGGAILLQTRVDEGTTFTVFLPAG